MENIKHSNKGFWIIATVAIINFILSLLQLFGFLPSSTSFMILSNTVSFAILYGFISGVKDVSYKG